MSASALRLLESARRACAQRLKYLTPDELAVFVVIRDEPISPVQIGRLLGWTHTSKEGHVRAQRRRVMAATCELTRFGLIGLYRHPTRTKTRYVRRYHPPAGAMP